MASSLSESGEGCRLRVLHIATMMGSGGLEKWLVDLVIRLSMERVDGVIVVQAGDLGVHGRRAIEHGLRVIQLPHSPARFLVALFHLLRAEARFDAVHAHVHYSSGAILAVARLAGVPARIAHAHNDTSTEARPILRLFYLYLMRWCLARFATRGYGVSVDSSRDLFGPSFGRDHRWGVLPCGIELPTSATGTSGETLRADLGIPADHRVLTQVGRLVEMKHQAWSIKLLAAMGRENMTLLLLGEGPDRERLEQLAQTLGVQQRVRFAGARPDVLAILQHLTDVFLFPSLPGEGAPIALIEAQATGVRCIISDHVQAASIIAPELVMQLALADGVAKWAATLTTMLAGPPALTPKEASHLLAESPFSLEDNIRRLIADYRRIPPPGREDEVRVESGGTARMEW